MSGVFEVVSSVSRDPRSIEFARKTCYSSNSEHDRIGAICIVCFMCGHEQRREVLHRSAYAPCWAAINKHKIKG